MLLVVVAAPVNVHVQDVGVPVELSVKSMHSPSQIVVAEAVKLATGATAGCAQQLPPSDMR